jgi:hypothetical protein
MDDYLALAVVVSSQQRIGEIDSQFNYALGISEFENGMYSGLCLSLSKPNAEWIAGKHSQLGDSWWIIDLMDMLQK